MASSAATASEIIASNDDLLIEILLRLPIKSLIKFKSVSKQWLSLISNRQFSLRRSASSSASASGLFLKCYRIRIRHRPEQHRRHEFDTIGLNSASSVPPFRSLPTTDEPSVVEILQSCNGLLLCNARRASDHARVDYFVCNPTTNQYTTLPRLPSLTDVAYGFALAFDPSTSPHYKVVCLMRSHPDRRVMLYSSDAGVWRSSLASFEEDYNTRFDSGSVFWNGSIHWPNTWRRTAPYFNIAEERIGQMPMPPVPNHPEILDCFCESRGHLHFVKHSTCEFQVWELEGYYSKWVVKYRLHLSQLDMSLPEIIPSLVFGKPMKDYYLCVICVVRCEVEKESYLVMKVPGKIMSYNFASRRFRKICDVEHFQCLINDDIMLLKPFYAHQYIESLACV